MKLETPSLPTDVHQPLGSGQPPGFDRTVGEVPTPPTVDHSVGLRPSGKRSALVELTRWIATCMTVAAVLSSAVLLVVTPALTNSIAAIRTRVPRAPALLNGSTLAAVPLILAGAAYILMQALLRPCGVELMKRLMLGSAFLIWGLVQLMPAGSLATELGSLVIALYVFDLALIIRGNLLNS